MCVRNKIDVVVLACVTVSLSVLLSGYFLVYASLNSELDDHSKDRNGVTQRLVTATHLHILKASDSSDSTNSSDSSRSSGSSSKTSLEFSNIPLMNSTPPLGNLQIPYIGIETQSLTPDLARALNIDNFTRGEMVTGITPGSPAERAGIDAMNLTEIPNSSAVVYTDLGDIILTVDGSPSFATDFDNLEEYIYDNKRVGENVTLTILRDGLISDIEFYTGSLPQFQWYENTDKGLKLKYPTSWLVSDDESHMTEGRVVEFSPAENNGSKSAPVKPTVTVTVYPPSATDGTINSDGNKDYTNIRLLNSNTTTLADTHAYRIVFNNYSTDYPIKVLTVFAIKDMHLYRIDYSSPLPIYEDYLDPAIEMIESFQFIE